MYTMGGGGSALMCPFLSAYLNLSHATWRLSNTSFTASEIPIMFRPTSTLNDKRISVRVDNLSITLTTLDKSQGIFLCRQHAMHPWPVLHWGEFHRHFQALWENLQASASDLWDPERGEDVPLPVPNPSSGHSISVGTIGRRACYIGLVQHMGNTRCPALTNRPNEQLECNVKWSNRDFTICRTLLSVVLWRQRRTWALCVGGAFVWL